MKESYKTYFTWSTPEYIVCGAPQPTLYGAPHGAPHGVFRVHYTEQRGVFCAGP